MRENLRGFVQNYLDGFVKTAFCIARGKFLGTHVVFEKAMFFNHCRTLNNKISDFVKTFRAWMSKQHFTCPQENFKEKGFFGKDFHFINFGHQTELFLSLCWKTFRLASQNSNLHVHLNISRKLFLSKRKILLIYHSGNFFRQGCQKCSLRVHTNILREVFVLKDYVFPFNRI